MSTMAGDSGSFTKRTPAPGAGAGAGARLPSLPGTRPSSHNLQLLASSGIPSLACKEMDRRLM